MSIHTTSFDEFFPPPKPGRNTRRLWPDRVHWIETKLRKSNTIEIKLDRVRRYVEKLLRFHIELARWEEEYIRNKIQSAVRNWGDHVWAKWKVMELMTDFAWDFRDTQKKLEALIANLPPDVDIL